MKGRTTRMVLRALIDLSEGRDVMIVGFTRLQAHAIAQRLAQIATGLGIPYARRSDLSDAPSIRFRAFDATVSFPTTRAKVHIDHTATFERGNIAPPACRSVIA